MSRITLEKSGFAIFVSRQRLRSTCTLSPAFNHNIVHDEQSLHLPMCVLVASTAAEELYCLKET